MGCKDSYVQGSGLCDTVIVRFLQGRNRVFLTQLCLFSEPRIQLFQEWLDPVSKPETQVLGTSLDLASGEVSFGL